MENISPCLTSTPKQSPSNHPIQVYPFSQEWVAITKEEQINLIHQVNYWKAQHAQLKQKIVVLDEQNQYKDAKIKDLQNRLFGKRSEKQRLAKPEKNNPTASNRSRGQQPGSVGHGRTPRPVLPVILQTHDLTEEDKKCAFCGLSGIVITSVLPVFALWVTL